MWIECDAEGLSPIFLMYDDIRNFSESFSLFRFSHVKRTENTIAHLVARWNTKGSDELVCMFQFPKVLSL